MNARKQRIQASHPEVVAMHDRLKEVVRKTVDGEHAEYLDGWSDERVQKETAPRLTHDHVARLRVQCFGTFPPRGAAKDDPVLASEVRDLRRLVDELAQRIASLEAHAEPKAREPSRTPLLDGVTVAAGGSGGGVG